MKVSDSQPSRKVPYVNLAAQVEEEREDLMPLVMAALARADHVLGAAVGELETALAAWHGSKYAVALNSGTDALMLSMMVQGIGRGDEVITPVNSFVASTSTVVHVGARPVLVDALPDQNLDPAAVERAITPRTKAIMPVHLTGRMADMDAVMAIARRHRLAVIEDAAQAVGSRYRGRLSGTFGDFGCFSAHPLKNLNACGDAGFLVTDRDDVIGRLRRLPKHGLVDRNTMAEFGMVSRLDTIQASILLMRLGRLPGVFERRRHNAALYRERLDPAHVFMPPCQPHEYNTFHTFVIQVDRRDALQAWLSEHGIGTG